MTNPAIAWAAAVIAWPVVYFLWTAVFSVISAPFFLPRDKEEDTFQKTVTRADLFEGAGAAVSQVLCLGAGKAVLSYLGGVPNYELALIYLGWAILTVFARGPLLGLPGRHGHIPDAAGMALGLAAGFLIFF